jgi:hypothetical protein
VTTHLDDLEPAIRRRPPTERDGAARSGGSASKGGVVRMTAAAARARNPMMNGEAVRIDGAIRLVAR